MKILVILFSVSLFNTADDKPVCLGIYKTEIASRMNVSMADLQPKTKEDSILLEFSKSLIREMSGEEFRVTLIDSAFVYQDSTVIRTSAFSNSVKQNVTTNITVSNSVSVIKNGMLYHSDGSPFLKEKNKSSSFYNTNNQEHIMGYDTEIFINTDSSIKIWVSDELPKNLNPGIQIQNAKGGILKYELIEKSGRTVSTLEKVIKY